MSADGLLPAWVTRIESALEKLLSSFHQAPPHLLTAMRYVTLGGGKRLRPLLVYATGTTLGADENILDAPALAVELIHAFSLVHDDLPAMDNDALRRGRPTAHLAFDEATAILAGDALQTLAFEVLANAPHNTSDTRIAWVRELATASGAGGMCGGQALDMAGNGQTLSQSELEHLHSLKTGALIQAAVRMGAISAGADATSILALDRYAQAFGLAFQIRDDILDVEGNTSQLGKTIGKDAVQGKSTYPALIGLVGAKTLLETLREKMQAALQPLGCNADALRALAEFAVARVH